MIINKGEVRKQAKVQAKRMSDTKLISFISQHLTSKNEFTQILVYEARKEFINRRNNDDTTKFTNE